MARPSLESPQYYLNRDTSWLEFNRRVLEEAEDTGNPLLERLKFLAISASNLDEFFEIRVAAMVQQIEDGYNDATPDGLTLTAKRDLVARLTHQFVDQQYECWNERIRPSLAGNGIRVLTLDELDSDARQFVDRLGRQVFASINKNGGSPEQKRQQLQKMFTENMDIDWMGHFVLGPGWRQATEEQRKLARDTMLQSFYALRDRFLEELDLEAPDAPILMPGARRLRSDGAAAGARDWQQAEIAQKRRRRSGEDDHDKLLRELYDADVAKPKSPGGTGPTLGGA